MKRKISVISNADNISLDQYKQLMKSKRVCTDLLKNEKHFHSIIPHKSLARCAVCGEPTYKRCSMCKMPLHNMDTKGIGKGKNCALQWHSDSYLGLCFKDRKLFCQIAKDWKPWSAKKLRENIRRIKGYSSISNMKR